MNSSIGEVNRDGLPGVERQLRALPDDAALALDNELDQLPGFSNRAKTSFQFFDRLFGVQFGPIQDPV
jgi:hypothetical protein